MSHLGKDEIERFVAGLASVQDRRRMLEHIRGCEWCRHYFLNQVTTLMDKESWNEVDQEREEAYDGAISRALGSLRGFASKWRKETERLERARVLVEQAGGLGEGFPLRQAQALHGWPLCEALLQKSFEERYRDPKKMLRLAFDAAGVAEHTPTEKYQPSPGFVMDLRARAFAELANAYRINDRFTEAEQAFAQARGFLESGTGDLILEARVADLEASLRSSQGRFEEAITLLEKVHSLYQEVADGHLAGRALISIGFNQRLAGRPREAVRLIEQGSRMLEAERDPELAVISAQSLLDALVDAGEFRRAGNMLLASGLREAFADEPLNLLKLRWVEGKIHAGLGRIERAEGIFSSVRAEFLALESHYDAALVGLELAALWLRQGRGAEVGALAEEMYQTFQRLEVHREAQHALYFVREVCRLNRATVPMVQGVRSFMERLARNPEMRFEPEQYVG